MSERDNPAYHEDVVLFRDALSFTQTQTGFSDRLIEKDYYCTLLLEDLLSTNVPDLAFKGGTSLSKIHGDFYRLSEDLDFGISTPADVTRRTRSNRVDAFKGRFAKLSSRMQCFQVVAPLKGYNNSTQYNGRVSYSSAVTGQEESVKVEISVREPILEPVEPRPARTLLVDPFRQTPAIGPIAIPVLSCREAYAEKLRASLTRRDPAVRDFYEVDYAFHTKRIHPTERELVELVRQKLVIPGNEPIDVSDDKREALRKQVDTQLKPVLRNRDFTKFDLDRAFEAVRRFATLLLSQPF